MQLLQARDMQPNVVVYFKTVQYFGSYSSFDLKPKCLQCTAKNKGLAILAFKVAALDADPV